MVGPSALHGRDDECRVVESCLARARIGRLAVLSVIGEPGTGKTALCDYAIRAATGFQVAPGAAVDGEADLALSGLSLLLRPLLPYAGSLAAPHRRILDTVTGAGGEPVEDRFALGAMTVGLLSAAAEAQPLLVVVDDVQWLDHPSARALSFALRRLEIDSVAVVLASRTPGTALLPPAGHSSVHLSGLDNNASLALLMERKADFAAPVARHVVSATAGNPLALIEVADHLSAGQRQGRQPLPDPLPIGDHLIDLYRHRVSSLAPATKRSLAVLAAAGTATNLVPAALEQFGLDTTDLESAEQARVVTLADPTVGLRFCHPLLRAAALALLTPNEQRTVHRALARAARGDPERYANHLAAAATGPNDRVADALIAAADRAERRSGLAAAGLLAQAALFTPPGDVACRRRIRAAQALVLAGQPSLAVGHLDHVIATTSDDLIRSDATLARASTTFWGPTAPQAVETIRREAERVSSASPRRAGSSLALTSMILSTRGDTSGALEMCERAYQIVRSAGADELQILGVLAATRILAGRRHEGAALITDRVLTQWLERAEQLGSRDAIDLAVGGQPLLWSEQHHRAQQFCSAMADACRRRGSPYGLANVSNALSESLWWTGRWPEAMGVAEEALTLCQQIEQPLLVGPPAAVLARLLACQGDEARCQELVSTALSSAEVFGHVYVRMMAHHAAGLCDLSARRPKEAMASLLKCEQTATQIGLREVCIVPYGADLVEALIQSGEDQQAKRLLALHVQRSRDVGSSWGLATAARCQAMLSEDEDADILFKEALVGHPVGSFEEGRTRLSWGEHLRRRNQRRLSRGQLERAATIFDGLGAQPWYRRASSELHAVGARTTPAPPAAMKTLTAKEIQVALAVARGMSNREVAAALFASPKTIEYHLRQVYAKLGVSRRTQLAHYLISTVADRQPTNIAGDGTAPVVTHPE